MREIKQEKLEAVNGAGLVDVVKNVFSEIGYIYGQSMVLMYESGQAA